MMSGSKKRDLMNVCGSRSPNSSFAPFLRESYSHQAIPFTRRKQPRDAQCLAALE